MKTNKKFYQHRTLILLGVILPILFILLITFAPQLIGMEVGMLIIGILIVTSCLLSFRLMDYGK